MTAALLPGAAVFVRPAYACSLVAVESPAQLVPTAQVIVIGRVVNASREEFVLEPEAFLKGPASAQRIALPFPATGLRPTLAAQGADCPRARTAENDRVLLYIAEANQPEYPYTNQLYVLRDGQAFMDGQEPRSEVEVVSSIREVTGQYIVIATSQDEGAGIDWGNTVVPLGVALAVIFGIGLVLMRVWHRIDPS